VSQTSAAAGQNGGHEIDSETAGRLRASVSKLSRALRTTQAAGGLTPTGISVLFTVVRRGPLRMAELAEIEALNPTMLSRIVGGLAERGLVRRLPDRVDRRAATVEATGAGRRLRQKIHRERDEAIGRRAARRAARRAPGARSARRDAEGEARVSGGCSPTRAPHAQEPRR
jgi:DNA-binding MarR family transcriptional regulator